MSVYFFFELYTKTICENFRDKRFDLDVLTLYIIEISILFVIV